MRSTINNLEQHFTEEERKAYIMIWSKTSTAIKEFKTEADAKETGPSKQGFFKEEKSSYSRDKNCEIDFTSLSVAINQVAKKSYTLIKPEEIIKTFITNVPKLIESLTIFLNADDNESRKKIYQNTLNYMVKIQNCFTDPKPKPDIPDTTPINTPNPNLKLY